MKSLTKQNNYILSVIENLKTPTIAQIKALELFLSTTSQKINTEEKDLIRLTLNSCNDMQKMIENYILISKINSEKLTLDYKYFNISKLVDNIISDAAVLIKYSELILKTEIKADIELYADKEKIKKAVENLLTYIINSACKNSKIEINLFKNKNSIKFEIISDGINEDQRKILQIFKQVQNFDPKYSGLFIAKEILKAHFGKIIFKTVDNRTTFGFCLPTR